MKILIFFLFLLKIFENFKQKEFSSTLFAQKKYPASLGKYRENQYHKYKMCPMVFLSSSQRQKGEIPPGYFICLLKLWLVLSPVAWIAPCQLTRFGYLKAIYTLDQILFFPALLLLL